MPRTSFELEAALTHAVAAGDDAAATLLLRELGANALATGEPAAALRYLRSAAQHAANIGEGSLGRALGDLAVVLGAIDQRETAAAAFATALAHLQRAEDLEGAAEVAVKRARSLGDEAAWAAAAWCCAVAGLTADELGARLAAARTALEADDHPRAMRWLEDVAVRFATFLATSGGPEAIWARGELGALWFEAGRYGEAMPLLARAAHEEATADHTEAATRRSHQLSLCLAMLGQPT